MVSNFAFLFATLCAFLNIPSSKAEGLKDRLRDIFSLAQDHRASSKELINYLNTPEVLTIAKELGREPKWFIKDLHDFIMRHADTLF